MDPQLLKTLQECVSLTNRLLELLEQDREGIRDCVSGELLAEYLRGTEEARNMARSIRSEVRNLQVLQ
ncbi:MAG: hypothetical protein OSJ58_11925 [Dysosmobacter sp.]|nr:hypothetical protein [Dysosmobacter sp.]